MSWRYDTWKDDDGTLVECHVSPEPDEADGWDGIDDERPRQYCHWHERSADALREFYELPIGTLDELAALLEVDRDELSFHDMLAVLMLRLRP